MNTHSFLKGTAILTIAGVIVKLIGSVNWIILSRVLSGEGMGLYQMAYPIYLLALSVSSAGIPVAIAIMTAEKTALNDYYGVRRLFRISLSMLAMTGLLFSVLLFFGARFLVDYQIVRDARAYYPIIALAPAIFFVTVISSYRGYFQGLQIMTPTAVSQIVEQLIRVITMLVFASMLLPYGLEYGAAGASFGAGPGAVAALFVLLVYYRQINRDINQRIAASSAEIPQESGLAIVQRIFRLALPISVSSIMLPVVSNLDLFIVPLRLEDAGFSVEQATELFGYLTGMAVPLVNLATILTASLAASLVPAIAEAFAVKDFSRIFQRMRMAMRIANLFTIPGLVGMYVLATPISAMLYGTPNAGTSIAILSTAVFLLGVHQITTGVLQGLGRTGIPVINMAVSAIVKVSLNWQLTAMPALGIKGAAWATVADIGVAAVLNAWFIYHYTGFNLLGRDIVKPAAASVLMGGVILLVYDTVLTQTLRNTAATIAAILAGSGTYGAALLLVGGIYRRDLEKIPKIGPQLTSVLLRTRLLRK